MSEKRNTSHEWIDITQPLTNEIAHWPGDTPFSYELSFSKAQTGSVNIGQMTISVHMGTHADAPFHFDNEGVGVDQLQVGRYIGPARLIDVSGATEINRDVLSTLNLKGVSRLLIKTTTMNQPNQFPDQIPFLTVDGVEFLAEHGVVLVGVDVPSVDPLDSKELSAHHALHHHDIYIVENLLLESLEPGGYEFIALPLRIVGGDGSPVRAVVRRI